MTRSTIVALIFSFSLNDIPRAILMSDLESTLNLYYVLDEKFISDIKQKLNIADDKLTTRETTVLQLTTLKHSELLYSTCIKIESELQSM